VTARPAADVQSFGSFLTPEWSKFSNAQRGLRFFMMEIEDKRNHMGAALGLRYRIGSIRNSCCSRVNFFMNRFRKLGFIDYNGGLKIHSSLLNIVLHD
jgi:hypothetical protein